MVQLSYCTRKRMVEGIEIDQLHLDAPCLDLARGRLEQNYAVPERHGTPYIYSAELVGKQYPSFLRLLEVRTSGRS